LSALNSAFAKGEISVYAFAFCERRNATCYNSTLLDIEPSTADDTD